MTPVGPKAGAVIEIPIHIQSVDELLAAPAPFGRPLIVPDAESFLVDHVRALGERSRVRLLICAPGRELARGPEIAASIRHHFARRREQAEWQLAETWRFGRRSLLTGFVVLCLVLVCVEFASRIAPQGPLARSIQEGLTILGWVALWRPVELLMYDWRPARRDLRVFGALERADIDIRESLQCRP